MVTLTSDTPASRAASRSTELGLVGHSGGHAPPATSFPNGTVIAGRFTLTRVLGAGGMGTVYEARDLRMDRIVAVKLLRDELTDDPAALARFEREARAASRIAHPSVVTVHDHGRDEATRAAYLVMERLEGESLLGVLRRERLHVREVVEIVRAIAVGLGAAHAAGVVHRDLKPDNVILLAAGGLKVVDFGIASVLDDGGGPTDRALTQAGTIVGTPLYMSPEAISKSPVGPRADLYSLGVILFEMIAGRPPFDDPESVVLLGMHLRTPAPALDTFVSGLPARLGELVGRMLAKRPEDRPEDAAAVLAALDAIPFDASHTFVRHASRAPSGIATEIEPTPAGGSLRLVIAAGAAALVLALALAVGLSSQDGPSMTASPLPPSPPMTASPLPPSAPMTASPLPPSAPMTASPLPPSAPMTASPLPPGAIAPSVGGLPAPEAPTPPPATVTPSPVTITIRTTPARAVVRWDGEVRTSPLEVARDSASHTLSVQAAGRATQRMDVVPDADRELRVVLRPRSRRPVRRPRLTKVPAR